MTLDQINWGHMPGEENITQTILPNGIKILCKTDYLSPSVVVSGYLQGGSMLDPSEKLGLALFTSYALMRGTTNQSSRQLYHKLESCGASFGFGASVQTTSFGGKSLAVDFPLLIDTLANCLLHPTFPADQIHRLQMQILAGLLLREQDTIEMASLRFDELLFPNHPYGVPEDGYADTISKISSKDLRDFHQRYYGPQGMVIVVVGAITAHLAFDLISEKLGSWHNLSWQATPEIPAIPSVKNAISVFIPLAEKYQVDIIMGFHGPNRMSSDYLPASLGNNILGQFGMMGRIGQAVREKSGLAYYASTSLNAMAGGGSWEIAAGVNPANFDAAISIVRNELERFISEPVAEEELLDAKSSYIGSIPLSVESNSAVAGTIVRMERFGLGLNYLHQFPLMVEKITPEDILLTAKSYIDLGKLIIVGCGPTPDNVRGL